MEGFIEEHSKEPFNTTDLKKKVKRYLKEVTVARCGAEDKDTKQKLADKTKQRIKSCLHVDGTSDHDLRLDDTSNRDLPETVVIKIYICRHHRPEVPQQPQLTLVLPTKPESDPLQQVACLPAHARHAQSWMPVLPWERHGSLPSDFVEGQGKGLLCAGYHLDELARGVAGLQSTCQWLAHERLPQTQLLAQTMVKHLGELATLMEGPNTSEWDKASRKLQRAHKLAEISKEVNAVSKERDDVAESLKQFVFKTLRLYEIACTVEQEWLGGHKAGAAFHGCTVCLINTAQVLGDIVDSLLQMADTVASDSRLRKPEDDNHIARVPSNIPELEEAVQRLQSLSLQTGEVIHLLSQWGSVSSS